MEPLKENMDLQEIYPIKGNEKVVSGKAFFCFAKRRPIWGGNYVLVIVENRYGTGLPGSFPIVLFLPPY